MSIRDRGRAAGGKRYEVRWREGAAYKKRRFAQRQQAEMFEARRKIEPEIRLAAEGRALTVQGMMATWFGTVAGLEQSTLDAYRQEVRQVNLTFGARLASTVRPSEVRAWAGRAHPGASIRRRSLVSLRRAYKLAVADGLLSEDPTVGAPLPRVDREEMRFLTWDELAALAVAAGQWAPLIWVLGTCGLRLGEAVALNGEDVDRRRKRLRIRRTKTHSPRDVPIMDDVLAMLPDRPGPLFTGPQGGRLNDHNWRERDFRRAVDLADLGPLHPHQLRHTAASLAIASGADVKAVQRMLGHNSGAMTLDLYSHLWDAGLDLVADRMDEARRAHVGHVAIEKGTGRDTADTRHTPLNSTQEAAGATVIRLPTRENTG